MDVVSRISMQVRSHTLSNPPPELCGWKREAVALDTVVSFMLSPRQMVCLERKAWARITLLLYGGEICSDAAEARTTRLRKRRTTSLKSKDRSTQSPGWSLDLYIDTRWAPRLEDLHRLDHLILKRTRTITR